jgi:hypothetical protein
MQERTKVIWEGEERLYWAALMAFWERAAAVSSPKTHIPTSLQGII